MKNILYIVNINLIFGFLPNFFDPWQCNTYIYLFFREILPGFDVVESKPKSCRVRLFSSTSTDNDLGVKLLGINDKSESIMR